MLKSTALPSALQGTFSFPQPTFSSRCDICPPGYFMDQEGGSDCKPCEPNFFNSGSDGAPNGCQPCPAGQSSFSAATSCFSSRGTFILYFLLFLVCDATDIAFTFSPCVNHLRTKTAYFIAPIACNTTGFPLPLPETQACSPPSCPPGTFRDPHDLTGFTCSYCDPGTASPGGNATRMTNNDEYLRICRLYRLSRRSFFSLSNATLFRMDDSSF